MSCQNCGFDNPQGSIFCQQCGTRIPGLAAPPSQGGAPRAEARSASASEKGADAPVPGAGGQPHSCGRCGTANQGNMRFCVECGTPFEQPTPLVSPASAPPPVGPNAEQPVAGGPERTLLSSPVSGETKVSAQLVAILKDGSDGRVFSLTDEQVDVGRVEGEVLLPDDPYLSPRHARLSNRSGDWFLRDLDSVNGIFVRIREPVDLTDGDMLLLGQQVLRFETLSDAELPLGPARLHGVLVFGTPEVPRIARLVQYTTEGVGRDVHYLYRDETVLGRENGDIVFTDDPFLSRRHAAITIDRGARRFVLRDLGSSNGTAIRFHGERRLADGDQFRIGRHLFRFDSKGGQEAR